MAQPFQRMSFDPLPPGLQPTIESSCESAVGPTGIFVSIRARISLPATECHAHACQFAAKTKNPEVPFGLLEVLI